MGAVDRVMFGLLVVASMLVTVLCCAYALLWLGPVPFPITALVLGAANWGFARLAAQYTRSAWRFAPLLASALVVMVATVPGAGRSSAFLPSVYPIPLLMLFAIGLGAPVIAASRLP